MVLEDSSSQGANEKVMCGGRMLFTGPDYLRDHRVTVNPDHRYVGIGTMADDGSSDLDYLWRADPKNLPRLYRKKVRHFYITCRTKPTYNLCGHNVGPHQVRPLLKPVLIHTYTVCVISFFLSTKNNLFTFYHITQYTENIVSTYAILTQNLKFQPTTTPIYDIFLK